MERVIKTISYRFINDLDTCNCVLKMAIAWGFWAECGHQI
jgi:hypothetical protein